MPSSSSSSSFSFFLLLVLLVLLVISVRVQAAQHRIPVNDQEEDEHAIVDDEARTQQKEQNTQASDTSSSSSSSNVEKQKEQGGGALLGSSSMKNRRRNNNNKGRSAQDQQQQQEGSSSNNNKYFFPERLFDASAKNAFPPSNAARLLRKLDLERGPLISSQQQKKSEQKQPFCFVSHGCWGGSTYGKATHREIAQLIHSSVNKYNASFVLAAGDNFYTKGIKSVEDKLFQNVFTNVYVEPFRHENSNNNNEQMSMDEIPFVAAIGNHDARGNIFAQVNMTWRDPNWFLPYTYFSLLFRHADLAVVVLDCPLFERCAVNPPGSPRCWDHDKQKHFFEQALKNIARKNFKFRIVMCHYPLYANGPHVNHKWLKRLLDPMMERYGVTMYINADNHYLQVSSRDVSSSSSSVSSSYSFSSSNSPSSSSSSFLKSVSNRLVQHHQHDDEEEGDDAANHFAENHNDNGKEDAVEQPEKEKAEEEQHVDGKTKIEKKNTKRKNKCLLKRRRNPQKIFYVNSGGGGGYKLHKKSDRGYAVNKYNVFEHLGNGVFVHCIQQQQQHQQKEEQEEGQKKRRSNTILHNIAFDNKGKELYSFDAHGVEKEILEVDPKECSASSRSQNLFNNNKNIKKNFAGGDGDHLIHTQVFLEDPTSASTAMLVLGVVCSILILCVLRRYARGNTSAASVVAAVVSGGSGGVKTVSSVKVK